MKKRSVTFYHRVYHFESLTVQTSNELLLNFSLTVL